jgi:hypothetical protein
MPPEGTGMQVGISAQVTTSQDAAFVRDAERLDGDPTMRLDTLAQLVDLVRQINPESSAVTQ